MVLLDAECLVEIVVFKSGYRVDMVTHLLVVESGRDPGRREGGV